MGYSVTSLDHTGSPFTLIENISHGRALEAVRYALELPGSALMLPRHTFNIILDGYNGVRLTYSQVVMDLIPFRRLVKAVEDLCSPQFQADRSPTVDEHHEAYPWEDYSQFTHPAEDHIWTLEAFLTALEFAALEGSGLNFD